MKNLVIQIQNYKTNKKFTQIKITLKIKKNLKKEKIPSKIEKNKILLKTQLLKSFSKEALS